MKFVISEPTLSYSAILVIQFGQLCSYIFHLLFLILFAARLRQSVRIAFENKSKSKLTQQTDRTESENGTIKGTDSEVVLRLHSLYKPSILIIGSLRVEFERRHSWASFHLSGCFVGLLVFWKIHLAIVI